MAEKIIQNPSITTNDFEYDSETGYVSAISGHPLAGQGGGTIEKSDLMWKPTVGSDGYVRWSLASSATQPDAAYISGAQGPQGNPGQNGTDGTNGADGISPTFTITPTAGGTHVVLSGAQGEESFDVLSGAAGAKGQDGVNGFSPTVSTATVNADASHTNGGVQVDITYKDGSTTATESYTAWHGNNGEGFVEASHYQSLSAGYADYARFNDNSVSSMDQLKGSIDWGNGIAGEYQTHSGDYVTSSVATITGTKQYALTTAGWVEVQTGGITGDYLPTSGGTVSGQLVVSGGSSFDNQNLQFIREGVQANGRAGIGSNGAFVIKHNNGAGQSTQLEFSTEYENGEYKNGSLILKAGNTEKSRVVNVTTSGYSNMNTFDPTNGPNYMLRKLPNGSFDIGAKVVNVTSLPGTTEANTYYFIYDQT